MLSIIKKALYRVKEFEALIFSHLLQKPIGRPIFLLGCGRSGKTTLGNILSFHPEITFLDDRSRCLWIACYPETDIWTAKASARKGKLTFNDEDVCEDKNRKLRALFHYETMKTGKPILIQSLAINNFRLPFIYKIFPDARFVHIVRDGIDVAKSIEEVADTGLWYGTGSYKWEQLIKYAATKSDISKLIPLCENNYYRGLFEWRLSVEAVHSFAHQIPKESYLELTYNDLVNEPIETVRRLLSFAGVISSPQFESLVREKIYLLGRNKPTESDFCERELTIAGNLLSTMQNVARHRGN